MCFQSLCFLVHCQLVSSNIQCVSAIADADKYFLGRVKFVTFISFLDAFYMLPVFFVLFCFFNKPKNNWFCSTTLQGGLRAISCPHAGQLAVVPHEVSGNSFRNTEAQEMKHSLQHWGNKAGKGCLVTFFSQTSPNVWLLVTSAWLLVTSVCQWIALEMGHLYVLQYFCLWWHIWQQ